jgi:hypothetical protein
MRLTKAIVYFVLLVLPAEKFHALACFPAFRSASSSTAEFVHIVHFRRSSIGPIMRDQCIKGLRDDSLLVAQVSNF